MSEKPFDGGLIQDSDRTDVLAFAAVAARFSARFAAELLEFASLLERGEATEQQLRVLQEYSRTWSQLTSTLHRAMHDE